MAPPHSKSLPPPPQISGAVQPPQSMMPPQPSPMRPQVAPADLQVTRPQPVPARSGAGVNIARSGSSPGTAVRSMLAQLKPVATTSSKNQLAPKDLRKPLRIMHQLLVQDVVAISHS